MLFSQNNSELKEHPGICDNLFQECLSNAFFSSPPFFFLEKKIITVSLNYLTLNLLQGWRGDALYREDRQKRYKFIPGLSGSRNSGKLHFFALIWFYTILFDIINLFGREKTQSQLCPGQIRRKPVFSFKRKSFQCRTSYSE